MSAHHPGQHHSLRGWALDVTATARPSHRTQNCWRWRRQWPCSTGRTSADRDDHARSPANRGLISTNSTPRFPRSNGNSDSTASRGRLGCGNTSCICSIRATPGCSLTSTARSARQSRLITSRQKSVDATLRGANVVPLVKLDSKPMKTKYGQKLRPEFTILEWRQLGGGGPKEAARIAHQPGQQHPDDCAGLQPVEPVSIEEEMNDSLPSHL